MRRQKYRNKEIFLNVPRVGKTILLYSVLKVPCIVKNNRIIESVLNVQCVVKYNRIIQDVLKIPGVGKNNRIIEGVLIVLCGRNLTIGLI